MSDEQQNNEQLSRGLKARHVQLMALGGTIGTGLFLGSGQSIHLAGPSIIFAYLIAGIACFLLMRALGELLLSDLNCHSYIEFITRYLGRKTGFVAGWTYWICWICIAMAEVTASGLYMQFWFPNLPQWVTGVVLIILLFLFNSLNVGIFGEAEFWFAIIKVVAIVILILVGIWLVIINYKTPVGHSSVMNLFRGGIFPHGLKGFLLSFQMVIFSFVGIEMIGMTTSETQDAKKVLPESINEVPLRIILFYVGSLIALMCIYPWNYISASSSPFVQVFQNIGIRSAAAIINFVVLTAAASSCNSGIFTTGRMLFSLASDTKSNSKFTRYLKQISKHQIPIHAIFISIIVIAISVLMNLLLPGIIFTFISSVATTCFLFIWGTIIVSHLKYRQKVTKNNDENKLTFKEPFYPYSDYFVLIFFAFVGIILLFKTETLIALIGSVIWLILLYVIISMKRE
ncbi:amino acid permease [Philodulcilactobacillus myokoensis]|uniref:Amino acid permease n=1 Tax=Philodulcilactobacillus myokoensis TaxID=2929573 RepID=A0A9W6B1K3_9LACO|nr:amino acid permease [Philodulcilactobacillus myokoensis]GLB46708.1 amino acid permease [Philodulcilactobacillus myokoensis]